MASVCFLSSLKQVQLLRMFALDISSVRAGKLWSTVKDALHWGMIVHCTINTFHVYAYVNDQYLSSASLKTRLNS